MNKLVPESITNSPVELVNIDEIYSDPEFNCRGTICPTDVVELARSIDTQGLLQPIALQPLSQHNEFGKKYRILLGNRRYSAYTLLARDKDNQESGKYKKIPAKIIKGLSELEARVLNLNENLGRVDLNIMQEATAMLPFFRAGWTHQQIAERLSQSTGWVGIRAAALRLEPEIQQQIAAGYLTQEQIRDLSRLQSKEQRFNITKEIIEKKLRGEKDVVKIKEKIAGKKDIKVKKVRQIGDVFKMQEHIQDSIGNNFGTRCLAWCAGTISDEELFGDIKNIAQELNKYYEIPVEGLSKYAEA